ncbi:MAG: 2Fe-2S iron-sulfur cluster-binding protein [Cyanobacteria bacterium P01_F01_bin.150]
MTKKFKVTLVNKMDGHNEIIEVADDEYLLDAAEEQGVDLPYSCRSGYCSSCTGRVLEGHIDQTDQAFLDDEQIAQKYALLCRTYLLSDAKIMTNAEDELY